MDFYDIMVYIVTVIFALLAGYLFVDYLRGRMCNVAPVNEASEYLDKNSVKIKHNRDIYLYTHTVREKRNKK